MKTSFYFFMDFLFFDYSYRVVGRGTSTTATSPTAVLHVGDTSVPGMNSTAISRDIQSLT